MAVQTELHHLFLQSCMSRRAMSEKTAEVIYEKCKALVGDADSPDYATVLEDINAAVDAFGFTIKRFQDEHSGRAWIAFCNSKSDELAKVATEYGPQEIAYFRYLIKLIMKSGKRYAITSIEARNAGQNEKQGLNLKASVAGDVLRTFVARGWLVAIKVRSRNKDYEMYQLSSRARMELEHYLTEEYPRQTDKDYECKICNELVMKGLECPSLNCKTRMHNHCARAYLTRHQNKCPKCKSPWSSDAAGKIGLDAPAGRLEDDTSSEDSDNELQDQNPAGRNGRNANEAEDEEDDAEGGQDEQPEQRRASKGKGRRSDSSNARPSSKRGSGLPRMAAASASRRTAGDELEESEEEMKPPADDEEDDEVDELQEDDEEDVDEEDPMDTRRAQSRKNHKGKAKSKR